MGENSGVLPHQSEIATEPALPFEARTRRDSKAATQALVATLLLVAACGNQPLSHAVNSGIEGLVLLGPTCPVETPDSPCPDRPAEAEISVVRAGSDQVIRLVRSGNDGRFRTALGPGGYTLSVTASGAMSCKPEDVTVEARRFTEVTIHCDTGIR